MALIDQLSQVANQVFAFQECDTLFPDKLKSSQFNRSEVMSRYIEKMSNAQDRVFGNPRVPTGKNIFSFPMTFGDINHINIQDFPQALDSDFFIVFGASFIKGSLCDFLVEKGALNIHMGVSPFYRGSSCNFWSMYKKDFQYMGATIHKLSKGLDSGPILMTVFPEPELIDPFELTMKSVKSAQNALAAYLSKIYNNPSEQLEARPQDRSKERCYTRAKDFTDEVAKDYLENLPLEEDIVRAMKERNLNLFVNPVICS